ncbi:MAG TPA: type VI secretion system accessory protein TagJ [Geminicoccaceae bacterium]|nr:type VI secretion system accessory protein TagJ [Geminicoccaceae bacterium]
MSEPQDTRASSAEAALREGRLDEALEALQAGIRRKPQDKALRVFLFQLLAVNGAWERALRQLNVLVEMDAQYALLAQAYRPLIACEVFRAELFQGARSPSSLGEPLPWFGALSEAARLTATGEHAAAQALRTQAFDAADAVPGRIDGKPFAWIADADPRLGPVLEVVLQGRYFWAPFARIRKIVLEPPEDLRDFVWLPARFTWSNDGEAVGFVPTRYPGSEHGDASARLARDTEWHAVGDVALGRGQRMFATDGDDIGLLEAREIELDLPAANGGHD